MVHPCNQASGRARYSERRLKLELPRENQAPTVARAAVSGLCHDLEFSLSQCHTLMLLVSEVVSNAVLHSQGPPDAPILLTASVQGNAARIAVTDAGHGFTPTRREHAGASGGYGLDLVDKAASRWGVDRVGGTRVWFELPLID
ncbi:MAG: ATP-binding protein [Actinomycetota bacterium]|nr:ATP-binding protein [Actinomycetota bacterium]